MPCSGQRAELGEGPVWSAEEGALWWVDITGRRLIRTDTASGSDSAWTAPEEVGCVALAADGGILAGLASGLFAFDRAAGRFTLAAVPDPRPEVRFNDAAVDPAGRLWAGTMHRDNAAAIGTIFRIEADLASTPVFEGLFTPNGLAFDAMRRRLYFSDSHPERRTIWVCDYDAASGQAWNRRIFAHTAGLPGRPDGAAVDAEGTYWICGVGGGEIMGYSPDGRLAARVAVPVPAPTKLAFGGEGLATAFLTSKGGEGLAGRLLRAPAPRPGLAVPRLAWRSVRRR